MDLRVFGRTLLRRWYLTVLSLLISACLGLGAFAKVAPTHSAEAVIVLLPPAARVQRAQVSTGTANPLLNLGGLNESRDLLMRSMGAQDVVDEMAAQAPGTAMKVGPDYSSSAPLLSLNAEARDPQQAIIGLEVLRQRTEQTLASLQARVGVKSDALITSLVLTRDGQPTVDRKKQVQLTITVFAGSLAMLLLLLALTDGFLLSRAESTSKLENPESGSAAGPQVKDEART